MKKTILIAAVLTAGLMTSTPLFAEVLAFKAALSGASQSPKVDTKATGTAEIKVDTAAKTISWMIKSKDLTGPVTAAHFHGPAADGANAPPEIDISKSVDAGTAPITDAELADLKAGKMYVNLHTAKFPDGEIRGQVVK